MMLLKMRLLALLVILGGGGLTYYNWYDLQNSGRYSLRLATFAPLVLIGGIFMLFFPAKAGKPTTTQDKVFSFFVLGLGLIAGLVNLYLMDPHMFGR